jgi:hypothetical protein
MFNLPTEDRLSSWAEFRSQLEYSTVPLTDVFDFWHTAPFVAYNNNIDPYNQKSWPTPWEIIVHNKYDEFTKALMMAYSIKCTRKFADSLVEVRTLVDNTLKRLYTVVCVDHEWAVNYGDIGVVRMDQLPTDFLIENIIEVNRPR